jgi:hypothetical protein
MPNRLDFPSVILTSAMVIASIVLWWKVMVDINEYGDAIRLLTIAFEILTFFMIAGCIIKYLGWKEEDLESMR